MRSIKILFITQEDPFYVRVFFEEFFLKYPWRGEIVGVAIAPAMGRRSLVDLAHRMYDFYGPLNFMRMGVRFIYYKIMSRLGRRLGLKRFYSIRQLCDHYEIPVFEVGNINDPAFIDRLKGRDLDLIISVAAPQIFRRALMSLPREGCINIHNGMLPKYRGMLPNFWQMFHGEKTVGTTVHRISAGLDEGEILLQRETALDPGESLDRLIVRTKRSGAQLMMEAIDGIRHGTLRPMPNNSAEATYFSFPTRRHVREFEAKGFRLL